MIYDTATFLPSSVISVGDPCFIFNKFIATPEWQTQEKSMWYNKLPLVQLTYLIVSAGKMGLQ